MKDFIFISHSSHDDAFVKELRTALEDSQLPVWVDSRNLRGGDKLEKQIETAIEQARHVVVVLSPGTINSPWVSREIQKALAVEKVRRDDGYRVIPLLLTGVQPSALRLWFGEEPVGVSIELAAASVSDALPTILAALGERSPNDYQPPPIVEAQPVEELVLKLTDPRIETIDGKRRASATACLVYEPANAASREVESNRFTFTAPLGPIEVNDLSWYLERYFIWPVGVFRERAAGIEQRLPEWGRDLYEAAFSSPSARTPLNAWQRASDTAARYFSINVDSALPDGASLEQQKNANEAASELLTLPWELLHDGVGYVFQGGEATRVRRRLPNRRHQKVVPAQLPIRILLVSPRPEDDRIGYIDHRLSAKPLMDAVESLGELAALTVLAPPTFADFQKALKEAEGRGERFDVVHFDGHGVYDEVGGLGALCFEDPKDANKLEYRASQLIDANELAAVIRNYRIPLVFLEACQTAKTEYDPTASVAAKLLEEGVASVIAMSHSVLVETAQRFVRTFYAELAQGKQTGAAVLAARQALYADTWRGRIMGAGDFHLEDWFVPVLYQEAQDPQVISRLLSADVQQLEAKRRTLRLGALPPEPPHHFQGRSRELLKLERLLDSNPYAVVRGQGGAGKTAIAVELARWLVRARRFRRAAFVSLEQYSDARGLLDSLGRQLLPAGDSYSVAEFKDFKEALQPLARALADFPTIIVLDNWESVLPDPARQKPADAAPTAAEDALPKLLELSQELLAAAPATRLVFTTREPLPAPFDRKAQEVRLGALDRRDAIALVSEVMKQEGLEPKVDDAGGTPEEISELVDAVGCHARALVVLAREVSQRGVRATTENLHRLMADLERKYPGDRENSLYASLELSLRRLPDALRRQARVLAVFHGGAHLLVLHHVLGLEAVDKATVRDLAVALIEIGLAEDMGYGHIRVDSALPSYMLRQLDEAEKQEMEQRWSDGMTQLTVYLRKQREEDAQLSADLTLLELPNIIASLVWSQTNETPELVTQYACMIEEIFARLGQTTALAQAVRVREQAAQTLSEWSQPRFDAQAAMVERLLEKGNFQSAYVIAEQLLQSCLAHGEDAYQGAPFDIARTHRMLGRILRSMRNIDSALPHLVESQKLFLAQARQGDTSAELMATYTVGEIGDCYQLLGQLDRAEAAYKEMIPLLEKQGDKRALAIAKVNLSSLHKSQGRYADAMKGCIEARKIFEDLGEEVTVASLLGAIGSIQTEMELFDEAEVSFRQALAIAVQHKDLDKEGDTLLRLGTLYDSLERLEEAATLYSQAIDIYARLQNLYEEGLCHNNLGTTLVKLSRYDEARLELSRSIECRLPFGHASELWKTWILLHYLEEWDGNQQAAAEARQQAIATYLAYRRDEGDSQSSVAALYGLVAQASREGAAAKAEQYLNELLEQDIPAPLIVLIHKLQAILKGDRDSTLAEDPKLNFEDAVELQLLLETLSLE